jgi:glycosyltransferase involved in cell wall biosynthesis
MRVITVNQDRGIRPDAQKGAAVHLAAMRRAFTSLGAEVVALDEPDDSALLAALTRATERTPTALIYERYALGRSCAVQFSRDHGIGHVLEVNAPLADEKRVWRAHLETDAERTADATAFANTDAVLAVSLQVAQYAQQRGAQHGRVHVCPNAIDTEHFNLALRDGARTALGLPQTGVVLGFHGRLRPWHRFDRLAQACSQLLAAGEDIYLAVIGAGEFEAALLDRVPPTRLRLVDWVAHEHLGARIAAFDLVPLMYDAATPCYFSPLKLAEAMACGAVPIVPALGDLPSLVRNDVEGLVYPADDDAAFVEALRRLIHDQDLRARMSVAAAARAAQRTWRDIAQLALELVAERRA